MYETILFKSNIDIRVNILPIVILSLFRRLVLSLDSAWQYFRGPL